MINVWHVLTLVVAGVVGGLANSMAGGASLFTFPALLSVGLNPIQANATNSFALLPGNSLGAYADRESMPNRDSRFWATLAVAIVGGLCGAWLLLSTSPKVFALLVPALIGVATFIFAFSKQIRAALRSALAGETNPTIRIFLIFIAAIYNGFFGAGVGVIFMAMLAATGYETLRTNNAFKNALSFMSNIGGIAIYIFSGVISWPHAFIMMAGAVVGGLSGGYLMKILPPELVRGVIIVCGCVMTSIYVYRYWL
jgi:uncharacterized protein